LGLHPPHLEGGTDDVIMYMGPPIME
jgi:hypothetical protein